jgi:competence protein ComEC
LQAGRRRCVRLAASLLTLLLALLTPQYAIISVGRQNTFGHPRPEIIQRLADAHARHFHTVQFCLTTFPLYRDGKNSALTSASNR